MAVLFTLGFFFCCRYTDNTIYHSDIDNSLSNIQENHLHNNNNNNNFQASSNRTNKNSFHEKTND